MPGGVGAERRQDGDRVDPRLPDPLPVAQLRDHLAGAGGARLEHADPRHRREVADHRRYRHLLEQRIPDLGRGQVLARHRLARKPVLAHQRRRLLRRVNSLRAGEALDHTREPVGVATANDPLEQPGMLIRHGEGRVAGADPLGRVREPQQVAMGHTLTLAVLDCLIAERIWRLRRVPAPDATPQRAAPAAEALDERRELEQMRARAAHLGERVERRLADDLVAETCGHRQREDRRVVPRPSALAAHADDLSDSPRAVLGEAAFHRPGVLAGQRRLRRVVAATLGPEDQEAVQPRPIVDRPGEPAGRVRDLIRTADPCPLRHATRAVALQIRHDTLLSRCSLTTA